MANLGFNLATEEAAQDYRGEFVVHAPGFYRVVITASEVKANKAGTGKILEMKYETRDGKSFIDRLNIIHTNETTQKIGRAALGKVALSIGHKGELKNTDVLHGRSFEVKVEVEEFESNTEQGKMLQSNKVTDYRPAGTEAPATSSTTPKPAVGW